MFDELPTSSKVFADERWAGRLLPKAGPGKQQKKRIKRLAFLEASFANEKKPRPAKKEKRIGQGLLFEFYS